jgi:hypothetical protein
MPAPKKCNHSLGKKKKDSGKIASLNEEEGEFPVVVTNDGKVAYDHSQNLFGKTNHEECRAVDERLGKKQ